MEGEQTPKRAPPPPPLWGAVAAAGVAAGVHFTRLPGVVGGATLPALPPGLSVVLHARLAGRLVPTEGAGGGGGMRVDRVSVAALDGLLSAADRAALLGALVCEEEGEGGGEGGGVDPDTACLGPAPPAALWSRSAADFPGGPRSWGLTAATAARVGGGGGCGGGWGGAPASPSPLRPALATYAARLAALFPGCDVSLMPAADMQVDGAGGGGGGAACCEAVMGTAAVAADAFAFHTDADPATLPAPTPWTAAYGRYANRDRAKPWLVTAVLCLNPVWDGAAWGGELRVVDEGGGGVGVLVCPAPGRLILMDQDATHCVTPPTAAASAPRYALVWKLAVCGRDGEAGAATPPPSSFSLGGCLASVPGLEVLPPADLGGAAALAVAVRKAGRGEFG